MKASSTSLSFVVALVLGIVSAVGAQSSFTDSTLVATKSTANASYPSTAGYAVSLAGRAYVEGNVLSAGSVLLNDRSVINGDVASKGQIVELSRAAVTGTTKSNVGTITVSQDGTLCSTSSADIINKPVVPLNFVGVNTAANAAFTTASKQDLAYDLSQIDVKQRSVAGISLGSASKMTIHLPAKGAAVDVVGDLILGTSSKLRLYLSDISDDDKCGINGVPAAQSTDGVIVIRVSGKFSVADNAKIDTNCANRIAFIVQGDVSIGAAAQVEGSIIAAQSNVVVGDKSRISGHISGSTVSLGERVQLLSSPLVNVGSSVPIYQDSQIVMQSTAIPFPLTGQLDSALVFFPSAATTRLPLVYLMTGSGCRKEYYTAIATRVAAYGFFVVLTDHITASTGVCGLPLGDGNGNCYRTSIDTVQTTLDFFKSTGAASSDLKSRVDTSSYYLFGHSYGGFSALGAVGDECQHRLATTGFSNYMYCEGRNATTVYTRPAELKGAVTYGSAHTLYGAGAQPVRNDGGQFVYNIAEDGDMFNNPAAVLSSYQATTNGEKRYTQYKGMVHFSIMNPEIRFVNNVFALPVYAGLVNQPGETITPMSRTIDLIGAQVGTYLRAKHYGDESAKRWVELGKYIDQPEIVVEQGVLADTSI